MPDTDYAPFVPPRVLAELVCQHQKERRATDWLNATFFAPRDAN